MTQLVVYRFTGPRVSWQGDLEDAEVAALTASFDCFFTQLYRLQVAPAGEVLAKEVVLFMASRGLLLLASHSPITPPSAQQLQQQAAMAAAVAAAAGGAGPGGAGGGAGRGAGAAGDPLAALPSADSINLHLVRLSDGVRVGGSRLEGELVDLGGRPGSLGISVHEDLITVLAVRSQVLHLLQVVRGGEEVVTVRRLGPHVREDDELVLRTAQQAEERWRSSRAEAREPAGAPADAAAAGASAGSGASGSGPAAAGAAAAAAAAGGGGQGAYPPAGSVPGLAGAASAVAAVARGRAPAGASPGSHGLGLRRGSGPLHTDGQRHGTTGSAGAHALQTAAPNGPAAAPYPPAGSRAGGAAAAAGGAGGGVPAADAAAAAAHREALRQQQRQQRAASGQQQRGNGSAAGSAAGPGGVQQQHRGLQPAAGPDAGAAVPGQAQAQARPRPYPTDPAIQHRQPHPQAPPPNPYPPNPYPPHNAAAGRPHAPAWHHPGSHTGAAHAHPTNHNRSQTPPHQIPGHPHAPLLSLGGALDAGAGNDGGDGRGCVMGLKQRLLAHLYMRCLRQNEGNPRRQQRQALALFRSLDMYGSLLMRRAHLLDRRRLLIDLRTPAAADLGSFTPGGGPAPPTPSGPGLPPTQFLMLFDIQTTQVLAVAPSPGEAVIEAYLKGPAAELPEPWAEALAPWDRFAYETAAETARGQLGLRGGAVGAGGSMASSAPGGAVPNDAHGPPQSGAGGAADRAGAARKLVQLMPPTSGSHGLAASPYLDPSLFLYDDRVISPYIRTRPCLEQPISFRPRNRPERLGFRLDPGHYEPVVVRERRLARNVTHLFHPEAPFLLSVFSVFQQNRLNINCRM
ncbi:hypothetical protein HYH03_006671 [Edaphochlamys debaryana]|uniref:Uncharacterized protein n=1 Tax=Edaphochlamys debaryana TaxID=47281 RepID=A0A835Y315_9CHLO|nr:hypothetical protein HYH03_006671 [Edaphochlamys debaryana]|eukprot:KAG2495060.1 hypothetical protein HYH03_006671 [Edaphochlamys debaryana]